MREYTLPSGAVLKIQPAPFRDARALYQAILEEARALKIDAETEIDVNLMKDLMCTAFSSKKIEAALDVCFKRALYNDGRISDDTWEPEAARGDYMPACIEVAKENILPFTKSLYSQFESVLPKIKGSLK